MKYISNIATQPQTKRAELAKQIAVHVAGHAAAICLFNPHWRLPPVFFQINKQSAVPLTSDWPVKITLEDGLLIQNLPTSLELAVSDFSMEQKRGYERAFSADIINLLAGPMAEAHYVALREGKKFESAKISLAALENFGGCIDLALVHEYLNCLGYDPITKHQKTQQLISATARFVSSRSKWRAISELAKHILQSPKTIIDCGEANAVLTAANRMKPLISFAKQGRANADQCGAFDDSRLQIAGHAE